MLILIKRRKYKPITTDADESSDSDVDNPAGGSKPTNATTSVFSSKPTTAKSGSFNSADGDDDDADDGGVDGGSIGPGDKDKAKKGKQPQKAKISRPPRIVSHYLLSNSCTKDT
jgi:hypothetical protein